ncbi:MAG: hypothetical protein ACXVIL_08080 [Halobacteriota archaeon]
MATGARATAHAPHVVTRADALARVSGVRADLSGSVAGRGKMKKKRRTEDVPRSI